MPVRAGEHTAEWASTGRTSAAAPRTARRRSPRAGPVPGGGFQAHLYEAALDLPGRYYLDGVSVERLPGRGRAPRRPPDGGGRGVARARPPPGSAAAYVSDARHLLERAVDAVGAPVRGAVGRGRARGRAPARPAHRRRRPRRARLGHAAGDRSAARGAGHRRRRRARSGVAGGAGEPGRGRRGRSAGRIEVRAEGPGVLVAAIGWDPGWTRDRRRTAASALLRVNHAQIGVPLAPGPPPGGPPPLPRAGSAAGLRALRAGGGPAGGRVPPRARRGGGGLRPVDPRRTAC